ncbi:hypothetical protein L6164_011467 [Bauhinia variegata]|uniref:Uncharacterized protein n=1 Tax=Bauhinia variegata TaxID=167791 RepID=A0ACB9P7C1_BAUVA|nr:hypothetical protein L6164_011467 [Bauhinia variegata]
MDWFSWLSRTKLDPPLICHYGLIFSRNQLQLEDATYFDHEFLQSMGISIGKHRLEILKLAKKEINGGHPRKLSGVVNKCLKKCASILVFCQDTAVKDMRHVPKGRRKQGIQKRVHRTRTRALSGHLDGRMQERFRMAHTNRNPKIPRTVDGRSPEK